MIENGVLFLLMHIVLLQERDCLFSSKEKAAVFFILDKMKNHLCRAREAFADEWTSQWAWQWSDAVCKIPFRVKEHQNAKLVFMFALCVLS